MSIRFLRKYGALAAIATALAFTTASAHDVDRIDGVVYTLSNAVDGNRVVSFARDNDGRLKAGPTYATGGKGNGGGLGNQGALVSDGEFLIAVNPGSDDISVFKIEARSLRLVDRIASGGTQPVSVTMDRSLVYVVNAGSDSIAGFVLHRSGKLSALSGSEQGLSGSGTAPAQIQFSRDGRTLIVTEKNTNKIDTFVLDEHGVPVAHHIMPSATATPFGFALTRRNLVLISEAAGGAPNASVVSAYRLDHDGTLDIVDPSVGTTQTAACWVVITPNGRVAFASNTGSGNVSSYLVQRNGDLTLRHAIAGQTGTASSAPTDMALSDHGEFLHVLNSGTHSLVTFRVSHGGDLERVGEIKGLPAAATGLIEP